MNVFRGVFVSSLLVLATVSFAQSDTGPDGLGLYFDQGATVVSATMTEETESVTAYLILNNPTVEGNLNHWSAGVSAFLGGPGNAQVTGSPVVGQNLASNMPGSESWTFEVSVGDEPTLPTENITVLAVINILPYVYDVPIHLYVTFGWEFGGYGTDLGGADFQPSSGSWDLPVAVINGQAPVAEKSQSWGQVKAIFR